MKVTGTTIHAALRDYEYLQDAVRKFVKQYDQQHESDELITWLARGGLHRAVDTIRHAAR